MNEKEEQRRRLSCCGGVCAPMPSCQTGDEMLEDGMPEEIPVQVTPPRYKVRYSPRFIQQMRALGSPRFPLRPVD